MITERYTSRYLSSRCWHDGGRIKETGARISSLRSRHGAGRRRPASGPRDGSLDHAGTVIGRCTRGKCIRRGPVALTRLDAQIRECTACRISRLKRPARGYAAPCNARCRRALLVGHDDVGVIDCSQRLSQLQYRRPCHVPTPDVRFDACLLQSKVAGRPCERYIWSADRWGWSDRLSANATSHEAYHACRGEGRLGFGGGTRSISHEGRS